jgi:electron transfer flavoprotein alpha/beta subunit
VRDLLLRLRGRAQLGGAAQFGNSCCQIAIEKAVQAQEETLVSLSVVHAGKEATALRAPGKNRAASSAAVQTVTADL